MLVKNVCQGLLDALYPPVCLLCGELSRGVYPHCCPDCFLSFEPVGSSLCETCGTPFTNTVAGHLCLSCSGKRQPFSWCRGMYIYNGAMAEAISRFKYGRRISMRRPLQAASLEGLELLQHLPETDFIIPVPLSLKGRWSRGFNQAHELALPVSRKLGIEIRTGVLEKRGSRVQVGLSARERVVNAACSFVPGKNIVQVKGRNVMLFDDVYTTGATARACAAILKKAGAEVHVLTLARAKAT